VVGAEWRPQAATTFSAMKTRFTEKQGLAMVNEFPVRKTLEAMPGVSNSRTAKGAGSDIEFS